MAPVGLVSPCSVRLWIDPPSVVRPDSPRTAGLDKIPWQTHEHVYWMEMTEPTMRNLFVYIDRVIARGYGYRLLVGGTRHCTHMLLDDPEEPLPIAEMISIRNSRHVRMWWSMNSPSEPMDLLFCGHRTSGEDGTPPSGAVNFGPRDNWGQSPNPSVHSDELDSDGHRPKSSAAAGKRITRLSTKNQEQHVKDWTNGVQRSGGGRLTGARLKPQFGHLGCASLGFLFHAIS